ncbi:MAG TPA: aminotransferase class I/II-fold pyridoxal phosphate-dependent enzyme [Thermoanaerobaculia bacterium]|nr:aminotransferase class I/II-fold pyridoxal phosphate-dependent enzyme [Thermoanaerobaculia bacterium]
MAGLDPILDADAVIERDCPALWEVLSPLGRRARQPANFLPLQTAEARGKAFNATIGQITDGHGRAVPLPSMAAALAGLEEDERSRAFLYSPVEGLADLRRAWREWQRRGRSDERPSSLPLVTCGTAQARCLALELFVDEGRAVVLRAGGRPGDRDLLEQKLGARIFETPPHHGRFDPTAVSRSLSSLVNGEPAVVLLEFPSEDTGYVPTGHERSTLRHSLIGIAEHRPLIVIVDDTWEVLETPGGSLFWGLIGRHPNLVAIKVDGADGHLGFPGGRVGFLTFPFAPESGIAIALESKVKMLLRAEVGSPSAMTQVILAQGLRARLGGI